MKVSCSFNASWADLLDVRRILICKGFSLTHLILFSSECKVAEYDYGVLVIMSSVNSGMNSKK